MSLLSTSHDKLCVKVEEFLRRPRLAWLIKNFLQKTGFALLYGEPGVGKTFYALDIACAVARGIEWRGMPTERGSVVYIAAEDSVGIRNRIEAYCTANQIPPEDLDLQIIEIGVSLMDSSVVEALINELRGIPDLRLIIIDTLAASTPGIDENNSSGMGMFVYQCKKLQEATGASIVALHHNGKDLSRGARGWSGLKGAADSVICIRRRSDRYVAILEKLKNGRDGTEFEFQLEQINLSASDSSDQSCIVLHVDSVPHSDTSSRGLRGSVLSEVDTMSSLGFPVSEEALISRLVSLEPRPPEGVRDRRREKYRQSIRSLAAERVLCLQNGFISRHNES